jgi:hypothetical protein
MTCLGAGDGCSGAVAWRVLDTRLLGLGGRRVLKLRDPDRGDG